MSGHKRATVSISQDEYDRLRDAEGKLRSLPSPSNESIQEVKKQGYDLHQSNLDAVEKRQARFQEFISGLEGAIQGIERHTNDRLVEIEYRAAARVQERIGDLEHYFTGLLQEQQEQYEEFVMSLHRQEQAQLAVLAGEVNQIVQAQDQKEEISRSWLGASAGLLDLINENYATGFFSPDKSLDFAHQLELIEMNFQNGFFDAVLVASQQKFIELSQYRLELERQHNEWHFLYQAAWEVISQELILVDSSSYVPALDLDGKELSYLVDVNFWNPGELDAMFSEISQMANRMLDQENLPDISTLRLWLESYLPDCRRRLEQTIAEARVSTINSQLRVNVADLIVQALQQQGFSLASCAYNDYDLRLGYGAMLTNIEGNEVLVQVTPNGTGVGENELHIQSLDAEEKTQHELTRRWQEVSQSLAGYGIEVGQYESLELHRQTKPPRQVTRERRGRLPAPVRNGFSNGN